MNCEQTCKLQVCPCSWQAHVWAPSVFVFRSRKGFCEGVEGVMSFWQGEPSVDTFVKPGEIRALFQVVTVPGRHMAGSVQGDFIPTWE